MTWLLGACVRHEARPALITLDAPRRLGHHPPAMSAAVPHAAESGPPARRAAVDRARQAWVSRLIDLSQRNNLLYYRPLKVGNLDLTAADRDELAELLSGKTVAVS